MLKENKVKNNLLRIVLVFWSLTIIFPLVWLFYESLKSNVEFFQSVWSLPAIPQWKNYVKAWSGLGIGTSMVNTAYYVGFSMIIGLFVSTINAFAFTRLKWRGRKLVWSIVMMSLFLPGINILVPQYVIMRSLHLTNSLNGLIFLASVGMNVFELMVLGSFMSSIPKELEESAYMDGATIFQVFRKVIIPLSMPGIVTIATFKFIGLYNEFLVPFIYLSDAKKYTIGVNMYQANQLMQYKADWVTLCAGVVLAMVPPTLIYILFQKRIVEGATLGAIKG